MTITLHPLEIAPVAAYLIAILIIGFRSRGANNSAAEFILGGRQLTLPAFVATLVTTWYGGILGVGEFTYLYGISNWVVFGLPYYLFAILFAIFLAPRIQQSRALSIPEQFYRHYGERGGMMGAVLTFFITLPAPYILMVGFLLHLISGWSLWLCILLGAVFSCIYVLNGGFRAVVRTDKLQFVLMFLGFAVLLAVLGSQFGGAAYLRHNLPALHLSWSGGNSISYLVSWFFIALWTFIDPGFHQRCAAAKSPAIARRGILISVLFWLVFDLLTTSAGLYARALFAEGAIQPALSFPILGHTYLPPLLSGLFLTGLLATIMSTVDSFSLLSAITIGHDYLGRRRGSGDTANLVKLGLLVAVAISVLLAILVPSVINIWLMIGNVFIPPLLLPILAVYFPRLRPPAPYVVASMMISLLISIFFLLLGLITSPSLGEFQFWAGLPPMYPGLAASVLIFAFGLLHRH